MTSSGESSNDALLQRKIIQFSEDLLQTGTLCGFKHFKLYLRSREELLITVHNKQESDVPVTEVKDISVSDSFNSTQLPYDKQSLFMSQRTQKSLSGFGDIGVGLPPASPCSSEPTKKDDHVTNFLLALYSKYSSPYVWVRNNHDRLVRLIGSHNHDDPLRLKSSTQWLKRDVRVWDLICELIKLCVFPPPANPLQIDWSYLSTLPLGESIFTQAALINFLQTVIVEQKQETYITGHVLNDLEHLHSLHASSIRSLVEQADSPLVLRRHRTSSSQSDVSSPRRRRISGSYQYPGDRI